MKKYTADKLQGEFDGVRRKIKKLHNKVYGDEEIKMRFRILDRALDCYVDMVVSTLRDREKIQE